MLSNRKGPWASETAQKQNCNTMLRTKAPIHTLFLNGIEWMIENVRCKKEGDIHAKHHTKQMSIKFWAYNTPHCCSWLQCNHPCCPNPPNAAEAGICNAWTSVLGWKYVSDKHIWHWWYSCHNTYRAYTMIHMMISGRNRSTKYIINRTRPVRCSMFLPKLNGQHIFILDIK